MTLSTKIMGMMILATGILLFSTMAYHYSRTKEAKLFNAAYRENSEISISSILKIKENEIEKTTSDYAVWDEMAHFVKTADRQWAKDNIESMLYTMEMSVACVYSTGYELVYTINDTTQISHGNVSVSSRDLESAIAGKKSCHFYLMITEGLLEVAGSPIVQSSDAKKTGIPRGYIIAGRLWDAKFIRALGKSCNSSIEIIPINSVASKEVIDDLKEKQHIVVNFVLTGSSGQPVARVDFISKTQLQLKQNTFYYFTIIPILLTLCMGLLFFLSFRKWVSIPLKTIAQSLEKQNPALLTKIPAANKEFHSVALMIDAFFEAKKKVERNIEDRKAAEERILKLSTALEQSSETIVITDPAGDIEYVNKRFYELTGYSRTEAIGKNPRILQSGHHTQAFYQELWKTISSGTVWKGEILNRKKDGELYWEEARIAPITNLEGDVINYLAVKSDITERKRDEEKLKEYAAELKETNLGKDKFFSILAHDLKSPFHSLLGYTEILSNEYDNLSDTERRKFIGILRNSTKSVYELVENLLQWSRIQSGRLVYAPEAFDISTEIEYTVDILRAIALKKNIDLINKVTLPAMVKADKNMVRSILQNLISNALKFTLKGGSIIITAAQKTDSMEITIRDSGVGMSAEELGKLFRIDVSFTRKGTAQESGTGLGLILCKELVQKNMGNIWVTSEVNKGSSFIFTLPAK